MAAGTLSTVKELQKRVQAHKKMLQTIVFGLRVAKVQQEEIFTRGGLASEVKTAIDIHLANLEVMRDEVETNITDLRADSETVTWARIFRPGNPPGFHHFDVDVSAGTLTYKTVVNEQHTETTAPFSNGDTIIISKASESRWNGEHLIDNCSTTRILLSGSSLLGSDNTTDISLTCTRRAP